MPIKLIAHYFRVIIDHLESFLKNIILRFRLLKCDYFLVAFVLYDRRLNICGVLAKTRCFLGTSSLAFGKHWSTFFTIFCRRIDQTAVDCWLINNENNHWLRSITSMMARTMMSWSLTQHKNSFLCIKVFYIKCYQRNESFMLKVILPATHTWTGVASIGLREQTCRCYTNQKSSLHLPQTQICKVPPDLCWNFSQNARGFLMSHY